MSYLGTNLNVAGSSTHTGASSFGGNVTITGASNLSVNTGSTSFVGPVLIGFGLEYTAAQHLYQYSDISNITIPGTLSANQISSFSQYMYELVGTAGTLTTDTAINIYNLETTNYSAKGWATTIWNNTGGVVTLAAGTNVTLRGTLAIPNGRCAMLKTSIRTTTAVTLHVIVSA